MDNYWAQMRLLYACFEADLKGPDPEVYQHEIPGGQLTNLLFQAQQLGLGLQWLKTKETYKTANHLLGDIVKVTPTSKVVGDLAQFMVSNNLTEEDVLKLGAELDFPDSVLDFMEGLMGTPYGGFPEPLRTNVLGHKRPKLDKRPGLFLPPTDFGSIREELESRYSSVTECDIASYVMYPKVFEAYKKSQENYGDISVLPTRYFLKAPKIGEEITVEIEKGKTLIIKLLAVGEISEKLGAREVFFELNGEMRSVTVKDRTVSIETKTRPKATQPNEVGAPMAGVVIEIRTKTGQEVKKGDPVAVLSAMKMEMVISAHVSGKIGEIYVQEGDPVDASDMIAAIHQ